MTVVLGIDPGCSGALVLVTERGGYIDHLAMPTIKVGTKSRVNGAAVAAWVRQYGITHAYLEQVGAMPGQGTASMFTFGHAAGVAEGILQGLNIPYTLVTPQAWKKSAGLIGSDKDAARSRATQLYPELRALDAKAKGQAIADALLIARFGIGVK
ncbi:crossover junction endodeoxyribonuclease RuvC [Enterobacter hormaechei]|uniref:crossover junction endodeoxyribonuclease RuvC n=1 Tax=Enterobacter hormaechei TaxID=158836 RepID=UPI0010BEE2B0|nr:crossover junction endodeoxyribonuclease RuvC [Enterobacter hormaechei]MCM8175780.1 crossover junction endodeoxyribonuclease RuvC [Enterobacter hormaechei]QWS89639.1 crossover junction endodeoxyribonuclease RuvC [Enterobacter hormaechei]